MMLSRFASRFFEDTLFRNSFYLMLATGVTAGFGFLFWMISARLFPVGNIGIATTLISVMNLVALLSLIGFDTTLVRFLPGSEARSQKINTALILVSAASLVLSGGFLLFVREISPALAFIQDNTWYAILFVFSCWMNALNVLTDAIFLSGKKTKYTLIVNVFSGVIKVAVPFACVSLGAMGIFIAAGAAQAAGTLLSIWVLLRHLEYRPAFALVPEVLRGTWRYSGVNYATSIVNLLPPTILPILIVNYLGAETAAYYYIVMMLGNLLYTIPWSASKSFFAESSHAVEEMPQHTMRAIRTIAWLTTPAMLVLLLVGKQVLGAFGSAYAAGGTSFLYLVTITAVLVSVNTLYGSIFKVRHNLTAIFVTDAVYVASLFGLLYFYIPLGLLGVGIAWLGGTAAMSLACFLFYRGTTPQLA